MRSAVLVVDMLDDFVDGVLANPAAKEIVDPISALCDRARLESDWIVVYANDAHLPGDRELRIFPPHAMAGTPGAEVIDELRPEPGDEVVTKRYYSAFTATELDGALARHDVRRLVVVGQHTDCCVRHTSYDAFTRGLELVVCPDGTTVFEPGSDEPTAVRQRRALDYLHGYYGAGMDTTTNVE